MEAPTVTSGKVQDEQTWKKEQGLSLRMERKDKATANPFSRKVFDVIGNETCVLKRLVSTQTFNVNTASRQQKNQNCSYHETTAPDTQDKKCPSKDFDV